MYSMRTLHAKYKHISSDARTFSGAGIDGTDTAAWKKVLTGVGIFIGGMLVGVVFAVICYMCCFDANKVKAFPH